MTLTDVSIPADAGLVDVLGYSLGGLAQRFAIHRRRRLVLISTDTGALSIPGGLPILTSAVPKGHKLLDREAVFACFHAPDRTDPMVAHQGEQHA